IGEGGSARMVDSLRQIAQAVRSDGQLLSDFDTLRACDLWERVKDHPRTGNLVRGFMSEFGLRNGHDLKLETPNLREDPTLFIELVRQYISAVASSELRVASYSDYSQLATRYSLLMGFFARHARRSMLRREEMRLKRSQIFGVVRELYLKIGSGLADEGVIGAQGDIFYLVVDEIF